MAVARVPAGKTRKTRQIAGVVVVERDGKVGHRYIRGSEAGVRLVDGWELGAKRAEIPPMRAGKNRLIRHNIKKPPEPPLELRLIVDYSDREYKQSTPIRS